MTEKLIISSHTAKAHIYNIYQKTGVHSRQELMDLVEDTDVADAGSMVREILEDWR
ncbi:helix-turn-helix transcriptional regulator [Gordonibacter sp.]|uniref:helix-turn-helix transcriptional regulator n=1 Tax=Gordonibacter sp. TaxID=1968902 RepID=UPI003FA523D5